MNRGGRRLNVNGNPIIAMLLASQIFKSKSKLITTAISASLFYLHFMYRNVPSLSDACISASRVILLGEYKRILWSTVLHGSDMHLYYNTISLLSKSNLERRIGSPQFLKLNVTLALLSNLIYIAICRILDVNECAVGYSGVLFGLKYVASSTMNSSESSSLFGLFTLPSKHIVWAELILIQLLVPNISFIGHLSGILAGFVCVKMSVFNFYASTSEMNHTPGPGGYGYRTERRSYGYTTRPAY